MILLASTSDLIQVVTASTGAIDVHASFVDRTTSTSVITPGRTNTAQITTATTTNVVASPGSGIIRNVAFLSVRNAHATTSMTVTIQHTDGTTTTTLLKVTLLAGEKIEYDEGAGFLVYDATGSLKLAPAVGRFLGTTVITAGTTFTTGAGTNTLFIRMVGGGGGGGGCTSVAAAASAAGGGGAGGYLEKVVAVTPNTVYTVQVGAAGTGASGAAGNAGTSSTFIVGGTTYTALLGSGALVATAATTLTAYAGGTGGTVSTNGDVNSSGQHGANGVTLIVATPIVASGSGGSGPFGAGGKGLVAVGAGNAGIGFGAGGGGAATGASTVRTGGSGTAGVIIVDEYSLGTRYGAISIRHLGNGGWMV